MSNNCQLVVFSNKAYNAIIRESFDKDPVETGGILLGHVLDNGIWIVMEVLPPGIKSIFQYAYFEYDEAFVNYLAQSVANQYKRPLDLLGLWHRHPGSMDVFSTTDDGTNTTFACQNPAGVISGLVNIDPQFRLTMYHLDRPTQRIYGRPDYNVVEVEVGDDIIPEEYFELRYYDGSESSLHPMKNVRGRERKISRSFHDNTSDGNDFVSENNQSGYSSDQLDIQGIINGNLPPYQGGNDPTPKIVKDFFYLWRASNKKWMYVLLILVGLIIFALSIKSCKKNVEAITSTISSWVNSTHTENEDEGVDIKEPSLSVDKINIFVGSTSDKISVNNIEQNEVIWTSKDEKIATVKNGRVTGVSEGKTIIAVSINKKDIGKVEVTVNKIENETTEDTTEESQSVQIDTEKTYKHGKNGSTSVGNSFMLPIKKTGTPEVGFESSDTTIASVSEKGKIVAKHKGTAIITIYCNGETADEFTIKVN